MELFIVLVFLFIIGKIIKWVINNAYIFENAIKNGLSMILPYVVSYFVLVFFHIPLDFALLGPIALGTFHIFNNDS